MMLGRHAQSVVPFGFFVVAAGMMTVDRVQLYHRTGTCTRYQVTYRTQSGVYVRDRTSEIGSCTFPFFESLWAYGTTVVLRYYLFFGTSACNLVVLS